MTARCSHSENVDLSAGNQESLQALENRNQDMTTKLQLSRLPADILSLECSENHKPQ